MYGFVVNCDGNAVAQLKLIEAELAKAGIQAKVSVGEIENSFVGMGEKVKGVFTELKGLVAGGLIAGGIFGGFEFLKSGKEAYDNLEKSVTRVKTVIQSTNMAAGFTSEDIEDQAKDLSKHIVAGRAAIMDAEGMQLSFKNIKGNIFKESMDAVADFATFYKEDLTSAALQVDKAINDPSKGFHRLARQGVTFTAEQEKQIVNYEKQNQLAKAQEVILKELRSEFGGQAEAYAKTDEGKIAMDAKQWGSLKLEIGQIISELQVSLLPVFGQVRDYIKSAFNSAPMQFFLEHLKDLLQMGLKIIPMWAIYKGLMMSGAIASSIYATAQGVLATAMTGATTVTGEAAAAVEGFSLAWSTTGVGAIAVALGLVVENIISMNEELDKAIDKKFKLSESNDFYKTQAQKFESIKERIGLLNDPNFGLKGKQELYNDIQSYLHTNRLKIPELTAREHSLKKSADTLPDPSQLDRFLSKMNPMMLSAPASSHITEIGAKTHEQLRDYDKKFNDLAQTFPDVKSFLQAITSSKGFKLPTNYGYQGAGGNAAYENAINTSQLAGASGGLGSAKQITININGPVQQNNVKDGGDIKNNAQGAIEILIRTLNNMATSQSGTM